MQSSRITILHALANVEQWAIDTAWDNIVRFGSQPAGAASSPLPRPFYDDFVKMALDEAKVEQSPRQLLIPSSISIG